jgi:hypothetical protein
MANKKELEGEYKTSGSRATMLWNFGLTFARTRLLWLWLQLSKLQALLSTVTVSRHQHNQAW